MTGALGELRETNCRNREKRPSDYGLENALAKKVRREAPTATVDHVAGEYGLTNGEARGVVYGTASRATINKVLKRGGWPLAAELMADVLGESLEDFIEQQANEARRERAQWEAREKRLVGLEAGLRSLGS